VGGAESGWSLHNIVAGTGGLGRVGGAESLRLLPDIVAGIVAGTVDSWFWASGWR
jgi:hypothetical protein